MRLIAEWDSLAANKIKFHCHEIGLLIDGSESLKIMQAMIKRDADIDSLSQRIESFRS